MKHGGESERDYSGVQGAGASADDSVEEESDGELEDITDDDGEAASADEGAPADNGHRTHHAATKSSRTASGAYGDGAHPHGQSKVRQDGAAGHRRNQVDGGGQAQTKNGYTCSRLHLGGEHARTCIQTARRWRLIIFSG